MDDLEPVLDPKKCLKTYHKPDKTTVNTNKDSEATVLQIPILPAAQECKDLTTKEAVKLLLGGTLQSKVCRYCLKISPQLSHLEQIIEVAGKGAIYKVSIVDIVASFHPFKVAEDPNFPNSICEICLDRAIAAYLFTQQCEQAERALKNCFDDIYDKLNKLDPLEQTKKRGRQKLRPNHNILHAEHEKVMEYAEPIIHIVNTTSEVLTEQAAISKLECLKCCEILPNVESLVNHQTTHPKTMWYNCRLCGSSFPRKHNLKKHFNSNHGINKPEKPVEIPRYECESCTVTFDKYYSYLQHIEKHKFKSVMEHVIEKRMDKLCSLCFGKGQKMVGLNEKVWLHGGNPDLTGERSLYSVLASTLPQKKNKYQELLIPTQASSTRYIKRKKYGDSEYPLSDPIIVTIESFDCHDIYMFIFSEPLSLNSYNIVESTCENMNKACNEATHKVTSDVDAEKIYKSGNKSVNLDLSVPLLEKMESQETINESGPYYDDDDMKIQQVSVKSQTVELFEGQFNFTFSNPDDVNIENAKASEIVTTQEYTDVKNEINTCNEHWIFDKSSNRDTTTSSFNTLNKLVPKVQPCKVCWLFKHLTKCEICGRSNNLHQNKNSSDMIQDSQNEAVNSKNYIKTIQQTDLQDLTKNLTWQCNICLTNNKIGKEMCDCCEAKPLINTGRDGFSLGVKNTDIQKDIINTLKKDIIQEIMLPNVLSVDLPSNYENDLNDQNKEMSTCDMIIKEEIKITPLPFINCKINNNLITPEEVCLMDTDMIETDNPNNFAQCNTGKHSFLNINEKAMDVQIPEETVKELAPENTNTVYMANIVIPIMELNIITDSANIQTANMGIDNAYANQFQFNVGWTDKSRKSKRKINKPHNK